MFEPLFSLQFVVIAAMVVSLSIGFAFFCALLQKQLLYVAAGEWLLEHIYCPLTRVLLLMFMAFLIFPLIIQQIGYSDLLELILTQDFLLNMVNILFVSSLLMSFLPLINHPALAMPLLGCIAIGLIFLHQQVMPTSLQVSWIPGMAEFTRIVVLMVLSYLFSRWSTHHVSLWLDYRFNITGSRPLVQDIHYLILQMPILLAYGHSLQLQITA